MLEQECFSGFSRCRKVEIDSDDWTWVLGKQGIPDYGSCNTKRAMLAVRRLLSDGTA